MIIRTFRLMPDFVWAALVGWNIFIIDQAVKYLIVESVMKPPTTIEVTSFFNLVLVYNYGISFGMFSGWIGEMPQLFAVLKLLLVVGLVVWASKAGSFVEKLALFAITGGALGNIADRFLNGAVTDYLDFHLGNWHWPSFNIADIAVVCGATTLIVHTFLISREQKKSEI